MHIYIYIYPHACVQCLPGKRDYRKKNHRSKKVYVHTFIVENSVSKSTTIIPDREEGIFP